MPNGVDVPPLRLSMRSSGRKKRKPKKSNSANALGQTQREIIAEFRHLRRQKTQRSVDSNDTKKRRKLASLEQGWNSHFGSSRSLSSSNEVTKLPIEKERKRRSVSVSAARILKSYSVPSHLSRPSSHSSISFGKLSTSRSRESSLGSSPYLSPRLNSISEHERAALRRSPVSSQSLHHKQRGSKTPTPRSSSRSRQRSNTRKRRDNGRLRPSESHGALSQLNRDTSPKLSSIARVQSAPSLRLDLSKLDKASASKKNRVMLSFDLVPSEVDSSYQITRDGTYIQDEFELSKRGLTVNYSFSHSRSMSRSQSMSRSMSHSTRQTESGDEHKLDCDHEKTKFLRLPAAAGATSSKRQHARSENLGSLSTPTTHRVFEDRVEIDLSPEDFIPVCVLGRGSSGVVYKSFNWKMDRFVALKCISVFEQEKRQQIAKELRIFSFMPRNKRIIQFYGAYFDEGQVSMALEYCDAGCLQKLMQKVGPIANVYLSYIIKNALYALKELHDNRQIHRDIKPSNILINSQGEVKLTDFGILADLREKNEDVCDTVVGTALYMSPERVIGREYSFAADIWSLGLTVLACALGRYPLENQPNGNTTESVGHWGVVHTFIMDDKPISVYLEELKQKEEIESDDLLDFVAKCLRRDPSLRWNVSDLLCHKFILKFNNESTETQSKIFAHFLKLNHVVGEQERVKEELRVLCSNLCNLMIQQGDHNAVVSNLGQTRRPRSKGSKRRKRFGKEATPTLEDVYLSMRRMAENAGIDIQYVRDLLNKELKQK